MGEDIDPLTTDGGVKQISNRGILAVMSVLIVIGAITGFAFGGAAFGFGVLFGGILSFANYYWLERSTRAIFDQNAIATTGILAAKYILRYVAIAAILLAVYMTNAFPVAAVIMGLSAFAFAVVIQGLKNIFTTTF